MSDSPPTESEGQLLAQATRRKLDEQRVAFGNTIKNYFPILFILTVVIATSLVVLVAVGFVNERTMDATVLAASVQVAFGMVLGFVCVYIGLMMTWIGIDAAYTVEGNVGGGAVVLKSASPGLLFALGGIVLVAVSLNKQIVYEENSARQVGTKEIDPSAKRNTVEPEPPKNMSIMPEGTPPAPGSASSADTAVPPATFSGQIQFKPN